MKKVNLMLVMLALLILGGCTYADTTQTRVRVIANSNSQTDQEDKIKIKNALLEYFCENKNGKINPEKIKNYLLNKNLKLHHSYQVEFKQTTFPAKTLNGKFIPSGTYMTLLITIGEGCGNNWWSILYPEFFGVEYEDADEIEYRSFFYDWLKS